MNDVAGLQAAAWLGTHALWLYAAVSLLLLAMTLLGWRVLRPAVPSIGVRWVMGCALAASCAALFAWLAAQLLEHGALSAMDLAFTDALARALPLGMVQAAAWLTRLGDPAALWVLGVVVGLALLVRRHVGLMLGWAAALGGNALLNPALKQLFERIRPLDAARGTSADGFSFPSGHSSGAVVAYGMLAYLGLCLLPPRWHLPVLVAAVLLAFGVGVSRIFLRVHFASDVLAGFASGTGWLALCITGITFCRWMGNRARRAPGGQPDGAAE